MIRSSSVSSFSNLPSDFEDGGFICIIFGYFYVQFVFFSGGGKIAFRTRWGDNPWASWKELTTT